MTTTTTNIEQLSERLDYAFDDTQLLCQALTHRSWCAENEGYSSNERLEFLGDAVLGLVVTSHLYRVYADLPEGALAKVRASVVSSAALTELALEIDLGAHLLLGKGEVSTGGRDKPSILADAMEAVIGAVYLDGGLEPAGRLVLDRLTGAIDEAARGPGGQDFKTRLQELAARKFDHLPEYVLTDQGPDHAKEFHARVELGGKVLGDGVGRSKKQAQQAAARAAWEEINLLTETEDRATNSRHALGNELTDG